jgi:hexosaminidase
MKKVLIALICFLVFEKSFAQNKFPIIPIPTQVIPLNGEFVLTKNTLIQDFTKSDAVKTALIPLQNKIVESIGAPLKNSNLASSKSSIQIRLSDQIVNPEAYEMEIKPAQITIKAKTSAGVFYAVQSLIQIMSPAAKNALSIPSATIKDTPRFPYRGMMLDVSRHFMPLDFLKKYIDELARLKINRFHWHLSDGQAFRFESKKYPLLHYAKSSKWPTNEGFYTQEEMKSLVKYAQDRSITIIPEIDVPGHSEALLEAYPEYGCVDSLGISFKLQAEMCPNDKTIAFVKNILDEVMEVFPSKDIHIGGDEASKVNWKNCPVCEKRMTDLKLSTVEELQSKFISSLDQYIKDKGRKMIGWDEIMEGGLAPNATVMAWRGSEHGATAAKMKHQVIMSPTSHCYFDYYQSDNPNEPKAFNGYINLERIYSFEPLPSELTEEEKSYILGAQANLWTEQVATGSHAEYMTFPRALALAEVAWSNPSQKSFSEFLNRLPFYLNGMTQRKVNFAKHFYEIKSSIVQDPDRSLKVVLTANNNNLPLYYTLDGTSPTLNSAIYKGPISITKASVLKVASVMNNEMVDETISELTINKASGLPVTLSEAPSKYYNKGGNQALTNGVLGSSRRFNDSEWLGWSRAGVEASLDLRKSEIISNITLRFFHQPSSWVWMPKKVEIWGSIDGVNYSILKEELMTIPNKEGAADVSIQIPQREIRYLKAKVESGGLIPENNPGAGTQSWFFVDEISVN